MSSHMTHEIADIELFILILSDLFQVLLMNRRQIFIRCFSNMFQLRFYNLFWLFRLNGFKFFTNYLLMFLVFGSYFFYNSLYRRGISIGKFARCLSESVVRTKSKQILYFHVHPRDNILLI